MSAQFDSFQTVMDDFVESPFGARNKRSTRQLYALVFIDPHTARKNFYPDEAFNAEADLVLWNNLKARVPLATAVVAPLIEEPIWHPDVAWPVDIVEIPVSQGLPSSERDQIYQSITDEQYIHLDSVPFILDDYGLDWELDLSPGIEAAEARLKHRGLQVERKRIFNSEIRWLKWLAEELETRVV